MECLLDKCYKKLKFLPKEMNWEEYGRIVGTSASIWTIIQMLAPVPICYRFIRKKTVGEMKVTPYVAALTSSSLWLFYGVIIRDPPVVKVNVAAVLLQLLYIMCYYIYCQKKIVVQKQFMVSLLTLTTVLSYIYFETNHDRLISALGFIASCLTVVFFASPLSNVGHVLKTWNSESLPRPLIIATFIVSVQWTLYGFIIRDQFIKVTNLLGTILSGIQILVILVVPKDSKSKIVATI